MNVLNWYFQRLFPPSFLPFSHFCFNCAKNFLYPFGLSSLLLSFYFIKKDMCDLEEEGGGGGGGSSRQV